MNATVISSASSIRREPGGSSIVQMDFTSCVPADDWRYYIFSFLWVSAAFMSVSLSSWWGTCCLGVLLRRWCAAELTVMLVNRLRWSIPVVFAWWSAAEIGKRHKTVATVVQMSLLLMNYTRAHFSSNEILNGVMRTSSPLCITELYKVMDLNGNSLLALMKHENHSQFTQRVRGRGEMIKKEGCLLS